MDFTNIEKIIAEAKAPSDAELQEILKGISSQKGASLAFSARLLKIEDPAHLELLTKRADEIKQEVYGKRVVFFAPLYLSNTCKNSCLYCGFRNANNELPRKTLTINEAVEGAKALADMGFKRILLVLGEDEAIGIDYITSVIEAIYKKTGIRILHLNAAPMKIDNLKKLKAAGIGVYQVFQETYHRDTYKTMHPSGNKSDFDLRLSAMDRAIEAGLRDLGIGALLGLYDYNFDVLTTIAHSNELFKKYNTHAHTISVPRLRPAEGSALSSAPSPVTDTEFIKIVAVYRLALPSAGVVISTRESAELRGTLLSGGASQLSAASRTDPGGYFDSTKAASETGVNNKTIEQFSTNDRRELLEVMTSVIEHGYLPSLCTTCYRTGRTGADFTSITSRGEMKKLCDANAILTLKEYTLDLTEQLNGTHEQFTEAISEAVNALDDESIKKTVLEKIEQLKEGKRDLYL